MSRKKRLREALYGKPPKPKTKTEIALKSSAAIPKIWEEGGGVNNFAALLPSLPSVGVDRADGPDRTVIWRAPLSLGENGPEFVFNRPSERITQHEFPPAVDVAVAPPDVELITHGVDISYAELEENVAGQAVIERMVRAAAEGMINRTAERIENALLYGDPQTNSVAAEIEGRSALAMRDGNLGVLHGDGRFEPIEANISNTREPYEPQVGLVVEGDEAFVVRNTYRFRIFFDNLRLFDFEGDNAQWRDLFANNVEGVMQNMGTNFNAHGHPNELSCSWYNLRQSATATVSEDMFFTVTTDGGPEYVNGMLEAALEMAIANFLEQLDREPGPTRMHAAMLQEQGYTSLFATRSVEVPPDLNEFANIVLHPLGRRLLADIIANSGGNLVPDGSGMSGISFAVDRDAGNLSTMISIRIPDRAIAEQMASSEIGMQGINAVLSNIERQTRSEMQLVTRILDLLEAHGESFDHWAAGVGIQAELESLFTMIGEAAERDLIDEPAVVYDPPNGRETVKAGSRRIRLKSAKSDKNQP